MATDKFGNVPSSLTLEPNPFEQSFASKSQGGSPQQDEPAAADPSAINNQLNRQPPPVDQPGIRKVLPGVQELTSPAPLLPGGPPMWPGSLRGGHLSPMILHGPADGMNYAMRDPAMPSPGVPAVINVPLDHSSLPSPGAQGPMPGMHGGPAMPNTAPILGPGVGENTAANGLYMLSYTSHNASQNSAPVVVPGNRQGGPVHPENGVPHAGTTEAVTAPRPAKVTKRRAKTTKTGAVAAAKKLDKSPSDVKHEASMDEDQDDDLEEGGNEKKRKQFLERNRLAAIKCRQRKKQWVDNLKTKVEYYMSNNEELNGEVSRLQSQVDQLKAFIIANTDIRRIPPHIVSIIEAKPAVLANSNTKTQPPPPAPSAAVPITMPHSTVQIPSVNGENSSTHRFPMVPQPIVPQGIPGQVPAGVALPVMNPLVPGQQNRAPGISQGMAVGPMTQQ